MLYYAVVFFIVAVLASFLGLYGVAGLSAEIGYFLAVIALVFLGVSLLTGRRRPPVGH
jgi:uncharacterized membrane protein YtjA (UPF0391 family)